MTEFKSFELARPILRAINEQGYDRCHAHPVKITSHIASGT